MSDRRKFNYINKNEIKVDGPSILKGKPVYTDDFDFSDALHVVLVRSPYPHAKVKKVKTEKALKVPGVVEILTSKDVPQKIFTKAGQGYPEPSPYDSFILSNKVRYVGDPVAIVAAETINAAKIAASKVEVEYEKLEPVLDFRKATTEGAPIIHDEEGTKDIYDQKRNIASHYEMEVGETDKVLSKCDHIVEKTYHINTQLHAMMEPHVSISYYDANGRLVVITSTQVPFHARRILSMLFDIPVRNIRVIKPRIGGGFGGKQAVHVEPYVTAVTIKTGRPARMVLERAEVSMATNIRHEMEFKATVGASKDGTIKALSLEGLSNTGAYGEHALTVFMVAGSKSLPLYNKVDAVRFRGDVVYTNLPPAGAFRGYGAPQGLFALDCVIDELASEIGMDPLELKQKNSIREGETSPIFKIMGEGTEGVEQVVRSCKLPECIEKGRELIGWDKKISHKNKTGKKVRGIGCALAMQGSGIAKVDMGAASLKVNEDGSVNLHLGATDLGTGSDTIMAQIVAETLDIPVEKVIVYSSDTDMTPFDVGAYASSTTYVSGNAVKNAAEKLKKKINEKAAHYLNTETENIEVENQHAINKINGEKISFSDLFTKLFYTFEQEQLMATSSFVGNESPPPYLATFAEVEVDLETGKVDVIKIVSFADCGTPINPVQARGQLEGATMQGLGWALYEDVKYDGRGRMLTNDFFTYKIPSRRDYEKMECYLVDSYEPTGPYGAKSIAEIGIDTPIPAIANAIYNATGIRLREVPFSSEKLLMEILKKEI
ncbi:MAG: molybdopterin-dependent oxidoreductase [Kosmotoga sp.]|nr:MAG: molybdopterin-dependent oxidoreductase [Kosmotoga sp.]